MNIFGIGGSELVVIILIMLIVAGPKRMIRWAYYMGRYTAKLRKMWEEVVDVVQQEVDAAGLDIEIPKELPTRQNITKVVNQAMKPYTDQVQKELEVAEKELKAAQKDLEAVQKPIEESLDEVDKSLKETQKEASTTIAAKSVANGLSSSKKAKNNGAKSAANEVDETSKAQERLEDKAETNGFGAWSNPQHPGQQTEQKAK